MNWENIKKQLVKGAIFAINALLVTGGVFYFKNQDQQKKQAQLSEEQEYNDEVAKFEMANAQNEAAFIKKEKEQSIANNPDVITEESKVFVQKTIPVETAKKASSPKPAPKKTTTKS